MELYKLFELENGLAVRLIDRTRNYYGDFWHVLLDARCEVDADLVANAASLHSLDVSALAGKTLVYGRTLEKMGVPSTEVAAVREHLTANFVNHSLPYLSTPDFAERFVLAEVRKRQKRAAAGMVALHT